jgi:hypothetical protein
MREVWVILSHVLLALINLLGTGSMGLENIIFLLFLYIHEFALVYPV